MTSKPQLALILTSVSTPEQAADSKQSLDTQERDLRAIAAEHGWQVLDVLRIPGFSRDYISWEECAQDMLKEGIPALSELKRYCDEKAFDVFVVRDADRFGRTQSLIMQIAETICIRQRLKIYSQIDKTLIEGEASRFWAAMVGLRSAGEMDKKKLYHYNGMVKRAENGFHENNTPWYHRTVRDPDTGKAQHVELREEYRYVWDAVYKVIVEDRIGFSKVEHTLLEKYHVAHPLTGERFKADAIYNILCKTPAAWGHRVRGEREYFRKNGQYAPVGQWVYNPAVPPPDGIKMFYNVLPPIYTGQQAHDMQDELRRRSEMLGSRSPTNPSAFSGLVVCAYCDLGMSHFRYKNKGWRSFRCTTHAYRLRRGRSCDCKVMSIPYADLVDWAATFLAHIVAGQPLDMAFPSPQQSVDSEVAVLQQQIGKTKKESTRLVERLGLIPDLMLPDYQRQMHAVAERLQTLTESLNLLKKQQRIQDRRGQKAALNDLIRMGLDAFWELEEGRQQQLLKRLFGDWRIIVSDGQIMGVACAAPRRGRAPALP